MYVYAYIFFSIYGIVYLREIKFANVLSFLFRSVLLCFLFYPSFVKKPLPILLLLWYVSVFAMHCFHFVHVLGARHRYAFAQKSKEVNDFPPNMSKTFFSLLSYQGRAGISYILWPKWMPRGVRGFRSKVFNQSLAIWEPCSFPIFSYILGTRIHTPSMECVPFLIHHPHMQHICH